MVYNEDGVTGVTVFGCRGWDARNTDNDVGLEYESGECPDTE